MDSKGIIKSSDYDYSDEIASAIEQRTQDLQLCNLSRDEAAAQARWEWEHNSLAALRDDDGTPDSLPAIRSDDYEANMGEFFVGDIVGIIAPESAMFGAAGEVRDFNAEGHPVVYISGMVNSAPVHGEFIVGKEQLKKV